ncbi:MAG: ribonuclease J [Deltaproteobacteria bacterium]|nr:ribonuclease J [Deltaproteobacteria bacterium]
MLKIIPLGGLGEIGLNMMLFEYENSIFIIDAGLMFPEDYMIGVDIVIPKMDYIEQNKSKIAAIVLTHGHEDHIGAIPYLLKRVNVPIFATPFTLGLIRHKLSEHQILNTAELYEIDINEELKIGPFKLEFVRVSHSVIDGVGIAIHTPVGLIVHTGDFKINHRFLNNKETDINKFAELGKKGVLALLSDSTNVEKEGYTISRQEIADKLEDIIKKTTGRVIVALFASNINRIAAIVEIAEKYGRKTVFNGFSLETSVSIAKELGYINISEDAEITVDEIDNYPQDKVIIITTGSQGEPMSSLARMSAGIHKQVKITTGDTIILSSKFIPGNERAITKIISNLYRRGADVIYEKISEIHVSGHAFKEELRLMISLVKPKYFIPIHGEYRHLVLHSKLAKDMGIARDCILLAENGQVIEFDNNEGKLTEKIATGRVLIDGKGVGDVGSSVLRERRILSEDGFVIVTMALDEETGIIIYGPEIFSKGFVFPMKTGYLLEDAQCVILEIVEEINYGVENRIQKLQEKLKRALRQYFVYTIKRRPAIYPFIIEV